jgi:phosphoesterase RecJ-like protein
VLLATVIQPIRLSLERAESILVISHIGPDGDAIASLSATGLALTQLGKRFSLVCDDGLPERFAYMPLSERIASAPEADTVYDLIIALDAGDESRLGNAYAALPPPRPAVINIDHHITNTHFGAINLVQPEATATVEVLFELFMALDIHLNESMAVSLLSGLVTDTLGFSTASVSGRTLQIASQLVDAGANLYEVMTQALTLMPMSTLLLWQKGLDNMHLEDGLLWTSISNDERREAGHQNSGSSGLGNMLTRVNRAPVSAVLVETGDGRVSVSFRCRPPYSVSELATSLGGGGHHLAAGCTVDGPLDEAVSLVISRSKASIRQQRSSIGS